MLNPIIAAGSQLPAPPADPPGGPPTWLGPAVVVLAAALVFLAIAWSAYAKALRVDRLHRQVLGSRATLEAQLVHRAQAAADLAASGLLDPASALLLSQAAHDALDAEGPIVDDGLDTDTPAQPTGEGTRSRARIESDLSRVIRTVVDAPTRAALAADPRGQDALDRLDKAAYRMVLARRFHNTHVAEARRLRAALDVRALHLAGHAPLPRTFDIDDATDAPSPSGNTQVTS
ncbi:hypothetical protein [Actinomyces glycerinitolerans]|uniref:Secreted protein n=1 Tax=Actinomyces glycerinitolerans TaxID=1892869 RepID=A0A1M4S1B8_9ACTO|nr:hypothetical protein [Actinomyces glycerinitolerans]SHE26034.1 Hypothetical protein ACGLYG10_2277 [Actinomyces glycerinitolerans]